MITREQLNNGHSLSSTAQPEIARLIEHLRNDSSRVTFVIGAGASVDSGLPTWTGLVKSLIKKIDPQYAPLALADADDPMRKAEYVIQMAMNYSSGGVNDRIQHALYDGVLAVTPGQLLVSLADLIQVLGDRASVITTNFDEAVERALESKGISHIPYTIDSKDDWYAHATTAAGRVPVMHLHGIVPRTGDPTGPVVLTESHFLKEGPDAREIVGRALTQSIVVFVGVSLTDPNLVGPLWDSRNNRMEAFAVTVPTPVQTQDKLATFRGYALEKARYLEEVLRLNIVALKSFGQLEQLVCELGVALKDPISYDSTDPATSAHYGLRIRRVLEDCYGHLGASSPDHLIPIGKKSEVADRLQQLLAAGGEVYQLLQSFRDRDTNRRFEELRRSAEDTSAGEERWGLALWLRTFGDQPDDVYSLSMVGSTELIPRTVPAFTNVPIEPHSPIQEARSLFRGVPVFKDLPRPDPITGWQSGVAVPVRIIRLGASTLGPRYTWTATIGSVCLTSSHHISQRAARVTGEWKVSRLAALDSSQRERLATRLEWEARRILAI